MSRTVIEVLEPFRHRSDIDNSERKIIYTPLLISCSRRIIIKSRIVVSLNLNYSTVVEQTLRSAMAVTTHSTSTVLIQCAHSQARLQDTCVVLQHFIDLIVPLISAELMPGIPIGIEAAVSGQTIVIGINLQHPTSSNGPDVD